MVMIYYAQGFTRWTIHQSTQSELELLFMLVQNSSKLKQYSLEQILKPINHPSLDLVSAAFATALV